MINVLKNKIIAYLCLVLVLLALSLPNTALAVTDEPDIMASAVVLIDEASGKVLYENNMNQQLYPASTTKIMTALLTLENMKLDDVITVPDDFVNDGEAGIWLEAGEKHTVEDLLMALMLRSANDAAQALAIGVAGSVEEFAELMNQKAESLGLVNTHFTNANGLHNDEHYTSAYDLAMITKAAMEYEDFNRIITTKSWAIPGPPNGEDRMVYNLNSLLSRYEYADGVKTGYTKQAGNCIVSSATKDGQRFIVAILNSNDMYTQSQELLEWAFQNFKSKDVLPAHSFLGEVNITGGGREKVQFYTQTDLIDTVAITNQSELTQTIDVPTSLMAPVHKGEIIGSVTYTDADGNSVSTNLLAAENVSKYGLFSVIRQVWTSIWQVFIVPIEK